MPQTAVIGEGMAGEPVTERDRGGPEVIELSSVPGFVVFDLPGAPESAGEPGWRRMSAWLRWRCWPGR